MANLLLSPAALTVAQQTTLQSVLAISDLGRYPTSAERVITIRLAALRDGVDSALGTFSDPNLASYLNAPAATARPQLLTFWTENIDWYENALSS
jgi:hypothetical protein